MVSHLHAMKASRAISLILVGFLIGAAVSWFAVRYQYSKWATSFAASDTLPNLSDAYRTLEALRTGDTNEAIEMLEVRLDFEIIALSALASEETDAEKRGGYIRALAHIRDYRAAHPRKTDSPDIDQGVADALGSVAKETNN